MKHQKKGRMKTTTGTGERYTSPVAWSSIHDGKRWPAQIHVGTGEGGSQSDLPWGEKKKTGLKQ